MSSLWPKKKFGCSRESMQIHLFSVLGYVRHFKLGLQGVFVFVFFFRLISSLKMLEEIGENREN